MDYFVRLQPTNRKRGFIVERYLDRESGILFQGGPHPAFRAVDEATAQRLTTLVQDPTRADPADKPLFQIVTEKQYHEVEDEELRRQLVAAGEMGVRRSAFERKEVVVRDGAPAASPKRAAAIPAAPPASTAAPASAAPSVELKTMRPEDIATSKAP